MSFPEFLNELMKTYGVTNAKLAEAIGVSDTSIKKWRKGTASPTLDNVDKLAEFFTVSLDEFSENKKRTIPGVMNVPIIGRIKAGYPVESYTDRYGYVKVPADDTEASDFYALEVEGDSMLPLVMDGDIIILDKNIEQFNNKICAITIDGESTLKRIRIDSTGVTLIPTNPLYKEMHYSPKKAEEKGFHVDGVLVQMIRNF